MRIARLHLEAFGCFTNEMLDFGMSPGALEIVYGPNEAGKSTALRAVSCMLFGFPVRTPDNFIHEYQNLRVTAALLDRHGGEHVLTRLKRNSGSLIDASRAPVPEAQVSDLLGGITPDVFNSAFGINHDQLMSGGNDLREGKGDLAESLFQGATGVVGIREKLRRLQSDAEAIFSPQARIRLMNEALNRAKAARERFNKCAESANRWDTLRRELDGILKRLDQAQASRQSALARKSNLERFRLAAPKVAERDLLKRSLAELGDTPILAPDATQRRIAAETELRNARTNLDSIERKLAGLQADIGELDVDVRLLSCSTAVLEFEKRFGAHAKATQDRPGLVSEQTSLTEQAGDTLRKWRPDLMLDNAGNMRLTNPQKLHLRDLARTRERLVSDLRSAEKDLAEGNTRLCRKRIELESLGEPMPTSLLHRIIARVRGAGSIEKDLSELQAAIERFRAGAGARVSALGLYGGDAAGLASLPLPVDETVNRFESDFTVIENRLNALGTQRTTLVDDIDRIKGKAAELDAAGTLPDRADLQQRREERGTWWSAIREVWLEQDAGAAARVGCKSDTQLAVRFESSMVEADRVSDALWRESERSGTMTQLRAEEQRIETAIAINVAETDSERELKHNLQAEWQSLWSSCGIEPLAPPEMRAWMRNCRDLICDHADAAEKERLRDDVIRQIDDYRATLVQALSDSGRKMSVDDGAALSELLECAEALARNEVSAETQRRTLTSDVEALVAEISDREESVKSAKQAGRDWNDTWAAAIAQFGLEPPLRPEHVENLLTDLDLVFQNLDEAGKLAKRVEGIDSDAMALAADLRRFLADAAPDLSDADLAPAIYDLRKRVDRAQREEEQRHQKIVIAEKLHEEALYQRDQRDRAQADLTQLRRAAGLGDDADDASLGNAEERSSNYLRMRDRIPALERELIQNSASSSLEEFVRQVEECCPDELPGQILSAQEEYERSDREAADLIGEESRKRTEFEAIDGGRAAADAAEDLELALGEVHALTERYTVLRLSWEVLRRAMDRYRRENQGPIFRRAGEVFRRLTLGAFTGLDTDFDSDDRPVLTGIRSGAAARHCAVDDMSTGTRDQLYFALRIAGIEQHLERGLAVPFIVDDVLIHFDDQRSAAALSVLADLAKLTQVVYFTHHRRIVDLAQESGNAYSHRLLELVPTAASV